MDHSLDLARQPPPTGDGARDAPVAEPAEGSLNAAISDAVVRTFKEYLGRGPTKSRTTVRDDLVAVLLEDMLTKAERTLVAGGEHDAVMSMRRSVQQTMREALTGAVEELTGRRVRAFMSDNHVDPDCAVEVFVLEPRW